MSNQETYQFLTEFINSSQYVDCARDAHEAWRKIKSEQGWRYGAERDDQKKLNPGMVPYEELPEKDKGLNNLVPYAVANFFRNMENGGTLEELVQLFKRILEDQESDMLEALGEYVHSHFMINLLSKGETSRTRKDMVVYQDLDDDIKSWDTFIALEVLRFLVTAIEKTK